MALIDLDAQWNASGNRNLLRKGVETDTGNYRNQENEKGDLNGICLDGRGGECKAWVSCVTWRIATCALMSSLSYRQAETSDIQASTRLRALKRGTGLLVYRIFNISSEHNPQRAAARVGVLSRRRRNIVGFIAGHLSRRYSCDGELQWIFVDPDRRGSGIASELVRLLAKWFVEQNAFKICVDVDPSNTTAHRLYKKLGAVSLNPHWLVWNDIRSLTGQSDTTDAKS